MDENSLCLQLLQLVRLAHEYVSDEQRDSSAGAGADEGGHEARRDLG